MSTAFAVVVEKRPAASADDAEQVPGSSTYLNSGDLELTHDAADQLVGIRFPALAIPNGATITTAWIQFVAKEAHSEATSLTFFGQAVDNAPAFGTGAAAIAGRVHTTALATWSPAAWTANQATAAQRTPELAGLIQEVVQRTGWASGNALVILVTGTGHRTAFAWDGSAANAPLLHVEYTLGPPPNAPPSVEAGPSQTVMLGDGADLSGTVTDDGQPAPPASVSITWTEGSGPGAVAFSTPNLATTHATFSVEGGYVLRLHADDGGLQAYDSVAVHVALPPVNVAPSVDAGEPQSVLFLSGADLSGNVTDDGLPIVPGTVTVIWTEGSGPGAVAFSTPNLATTHATFSVEGDYVLRLHADDGELQAYDSVAVHVDPPPPNVAPAVEAGPPQSVLLGNGADLSGSVTDDGLPIVPGTFTVIWTEGTGPGSVTFSTPDLVTTHATFSVEGDYVLRLHADDGDFQAYDSVAVHVDPPPPNVAPAVEAGPPQSVLLGNGADLSGSVTDDGLPIVPGTFTVIWTEGTGPGSVTFSTPDLVTTHATFSVEGDYVLRLHADDGELQAYDSVAVHVDPPPPSQRPDGSIDTPTGNVTILRGQTVTFTGTANDPDFETPYEYRWDFGGGAANATVEDPGAVVFNTSGLFTVTFTVTDAAGLADLSSATRTVRVNNAVPGSAERRVAATSDDAEESAAGGVNLTSSDLELVNDGSNQTVGMRFANLAIPVGATITSAWIQFSAKEAQTEITNLVFGGEAADNAATFGTGTRNVSNRARTTASVVWSPAAWSAGQTTATQLTPNLAAVIQEVVGRTNWASGNALSIIATGTGHRTAWSRDGSTTLAPLLHVDFETGPPPNQAPVVEAGAHQTVVISLGADLAGTVTDDGLPVPPSQSIEWSAKPGPGTVGFSSVGAATTHATFSATGTYELVLVVSDGELTTRDSLTVDVQPDPPELPPVASLVVTKNASPPLTVTASGAGSTDTDLTPIDHYTFDFGDGSGPVVVFAPNATAQHTYLAAGAYTVSLIATDTVNQPSVADTQSIALSVMVPGSAERRVAASSDDAEESAAGAVNLTSGDLELVFDGSNQVVGMRFANLAIPNGATITSAWIQFTAKEAQSEVTSLLFRGEAADNAGAFATGTRNVSNRVRTTSSVAWSPAAWTAGQTTATQLTPNLAPLVQEIVDRANWASGNALSIIVTGTGHRTTWSRDGSTTLAPLLHVDFETGPPVNRAPVIDAGGGQTVVITNGAILEGSVTDDGLPAPSALTIEWIAKPGPGTVVFSPPGTAGTRATFSATGAYQLVLAASDGALYARDSLTVVVQPDLPPVAVVRVTRDASPPFTVTADGSSSTDGDGTPIDQYTFDFGDGSPAVVTSAPTTIARHTYAQVGVYTVSLIATDTANLPSVADTESIVISIPGGTIERRVLTSSDDAEQAATGVVNLTSSDLELVRDNADQVVGLRWTSLGIPAGVQITAAYVQFAAKEAQTEVTNLTLRGQAADNAATFTTTASGVSSRPQTTAFATWSPAAWTAGQSGAAQRTSDLSGVLQEIVGRTGWASGNALALILSGTGHRTAWSIDGSTTLAPLLHVEYNGGAPVIDAPPVARLTVTRTSSTSLQVTADGSASTDTDATPIASYRFTWGDGTSATTVNAPTASAQHTYATAGTYTVTLIVTDSGGLVSSSVTQSVTVSTGGGSTGGVAVYVGYYDTHHAVNPQPKPNPWSGGSNVKFVGTPDPGTSNGWDSSALRIDNLGSTTLSSVVVQCVIGSHSYALWGTQSIAPGERLILAQTGFENFDGSDTNPAGCYSCPASDCVNKVSTTLPVVRVTINGTRTDYVDEGQVLNTKGVDGAGCPFTGYGSRLDESHNWVQVVPGSASLLAQSPGTNDAGAIDVARLWLSTPSPNPNRGALTMQFGIPTRTAVQAGVYDVAGRLVKMCTDRIYEPGNYHERIDLSGVSAGVYYYRMWTPEATIKRSFVLSP